MHFGSVNIGEQLGHGMADLDRVANAINAITWANLSSAVAEHEEWRHLVNEYFLFSEEFDDSEDSDQESESEAEENDGEDVGESSDGEDLPMVVPDPTQKVRDQERAKCDKFR